MKQCPKLLVISNECISNVSSNGRTLRNFLIGWPKEQLAQFCIRSTAPDRSVCDNFFCVSDGVALQSFLKGKQATGIMPETNVHTENGSRAGGRNPLTMLLRNLAWNSMRWAGKSFYNWVEAFSPELILLQAGDCAFMLNLARKLAVKYNIPLVVYNSEAYYFKKFDYFRSSGIAKLFYPLFHSQLCRAFKKCVKVASKSIYCCDKLKADYDEAFDLPSEVIYTVTQLEQGEKIQNEKLRIAYLGNLGVGRHEGLVEIGEALQNISQELKLNVYGKIPNQTVQTAFDACKGISYQGFVSYEQVIDIIHNSDILLHTESFSDFYKEDLKYAFSTKIADSLASGTCFVLYAPENMACTEYLLNNEAAWVITNKEALRPVLKHLCDDAQARMTYVKKAQQLVREKHSPLKNTERFQAILCECVKKG